MGYPETIPLKRYRANWRPPHLTVQPERLSIHLPQYFGKKTWVVDPSEVLVAQIAATFVPRAADYRNVPEVPFFPTTAVVASPNVLLIFRSPQKVPPLKLIVAIAGSVDLPFGYRTSRSEEGAVVDGIQLRAEDAAAAIEKLKAVGCEEVSDPDAWILANRELLDASPESDAIRLHR